ncbi:MAG: hypothetical protein H0X37_14370 [Herpetosiphonaceae bacterium]|nr:hypothetical protein [Herpetosiphonaceae bacterium]
MQKPRLGTATPKIAWLAVTVGFLVDTMLSEFIATICRAVDPTVVGQADNSTFASTTGIVLWVASIFATGLGGYVAARWAKRERVLHGVLVGGLGIGMMLLFAVLDSSVTYNGLDLSLQFLATLMGGVGGLLSSRLPTRQDDV